MALDDDWITDLYFSELSNGITLLERILRQEREVVIERCRQELATIPNDVRETDDGIEIRVTQREREIATEIEQVAQEIPRLLMKNMIVGTWSFFEGNMIGLAQSRITAVGDLSDASFAAFCREVVELLLAHLKEIKRRTYIPFKDEALERRMHASKQRDGL